MKSLIGMPVIRAGKCVGRVVQVQISPDLTRMLGLWMDAGLQGTRFVEAGQVDMLGDVCVMVLGMGRRKKFRPESFMRRAVSTGGKRIGAIVSCEVDEADFSVTALELSYGFVDDLLIGRRLVRFFTVKSPSGEVVVDEKTIVRPESTGRKGEHGDGQGTGQGYDYRGHDRRVSGNDIWHDELADGETLGATGDADNAEGQNEGE